MKHEQFTDAEFENMPTLIKQLLAEHRFQMEKWGVQTHSLFEWLAYTTEELGELSQAISNYMYENGSLLNVSREALQVATLSLKIVEMCNRKIQEKS